ncbi:hypothetical protein PRK78_005771 [Emydomyces testavorans]|uniref:Aminoglycoside phosphotransferase domain-containing protein n=1 Tax=Emydomyces testavorans TaxID=2070801 RepID=A0AAF0DK76_9EURO|nr:hypothetical protein PRK78_005771 [Emydomyces testavorans]
MDPYTPQEGYGQVIRNYCRTVTRLDEHRILKRTAIRQAKEVDAMKFVADHTSIPVPKVYASRHVDGTECLEIVMEYMPGRPLDEVWASLTHDQKIATCRELGGYLAQLKALKGKRIEAINGAVVHVGIRCPRRGGPFDTERQFNDFLLEGPPRGTSHFEEHYIRAGLGDNHDIHFAHGDFAPRNILVDDNGHVTAVLDWENSGWFPAYWDYIRLFFEPCEKNMQDYADYARYILPYKYETEIVAYRWLLDLSEARFVVHASANW